MKNQKLIISASSILLGFFVMGFCDIVGLSSDYVQRTFNWSPTMTGFIPSMVFIWFLFLGIPIGNKMNQWGRKNTVLLSMLVTIIGMFLPLLVFNSITCIIAYALLGIGNAILQVSLNPLLNNIIKNDKMLTSSLTAGQVIKAISSLVGPEFILLAVFLFGEDKWYYCFPILGIITLLSSIWLALTPIQRESKISNQITIKDTFSLLKNKIILLLFLGIFFIVGVDVATNYISSKLMAIRFNWSETQVKFAPQVYFLCRTIGALFGVFILTKVSDIKYFKSNILACAFSLILLMFVASSTLDLILIGTVGFFVSSIFPIIYSMAIREKPNKANQISGLMITAIAGGALVTPAIGFAIANIGITAGISIIFICVMYLSFCAFTIK